MTEMLDATQALYEFLVSDPKAQGIRDTLVAIDGDPQIYYAGDVIPAVLNAAEDARGTNNLALCLSIRDLGDRPTRFPDQTVQSVMLYIYDRRRGYTNIRRTRNAIQEVLPPLSVVSLTLVPGAGGKKRGILNFTWGGRAGHRLDDRLQVEYDAIVYTAQVIYDTD